MKIYPILFLALLLSAYSCKKEGASIDKPELAFVSLSPDKVISGYDKDTVLISLRYTMAINAIGNATSPTEVILKDSREPTIEERLPFPEEIAEDQPDNLPDGKNNISGTITLRLPAARYLVLRPDRPDGDTLRYTIFLEDKNGTRSDSLISPEVFIFP